MNDLTISSSAMGRSSIPAHLDDLDTSEIPGEVAAFPGMTTAAEKNSLYWLARNHFRGDGIIVDAGLFLGASTNAFALGLRDNSLLAARSAVGKPITSYDIAVWVGSMDRYLENETVRAALDGFRPKPGDSFQPILERLLRQHAALVDLRIGDIAKLAHTDRPVEIAFYDCLKTFERDRAAYFAFAPHYVPGHTIVVQQDYFYESAAHLKIRQEFLAPYFTFLGGVEDSAFFMFERPIPKEHFMADPVLDLSIDEKVALLRSAVERAPTPRKVFYTRLSIIEFLLENNLRDRARAELEGVMAEMDPLPERAYGPRVTRILDNLAAVTRRKAG